MQSSIVLLLGIALAGVSNAQNRPVTKVVNLLKDMKSQLEKEAEEDQEVYDKMVCWCETNDREKTKAIKDAEARIAELEQTVEKLTGDSGRLTSDIKQHEGEEAEARESLDKATELREKQLAEFNAEEKDLLASISSLKAAVTILGKHNDASFLQIPKESLYAVADALEKHGDMLKSVLTPAERDTVGAFVQSGYFPGGQSYQPQSGQIFGILSQMKETFENNLAGSQKDETANQKAYEDLKAEKEKQVEEARGLVETKTVSLAEADEANAQAKVDIKDTKSTLAADQEFLAMLKDKCAQMDAEWAERSKTRQLETEAVSKALAFLSSDDAKDLFTKTFNFVQKSQISATRSQVAKFATQEASRLHSVELANLGMMVKNDVFKKILVYIKDMIKKLQHANLDDIKQKDFCFDAFNENQLEMEAKQREKKASAATIEDFQAKIEASGKEIESLKKQLVDSATNFKRASENREIENRDFQLLINDQRATQQLLQKALDVLKGFYDKESLIQQPAFKEYKKNESAGGVTGMIQNIINDANTLEKEAIRDEADAQKAYEAFVKETNTDNDAKQKSLVEISEQKAEAEQSMADQKVDDVAIDGTLKDLIAKNTTLHGSCDFLMKNFEIRQQARHEEMEAFKKAKAFLEGSNLR